VQACSQGPQWHQRIYWISETKIGTAPLQENATAADFATDGQYQRRGGLTIATAALHRRQRRRSL